MVLFNEKKKKSESIYNVILVHRAAHTVSTGGPASSSLSASCVPFPCCGPSTCSSSVWWDDCRRTSLEITEQRKNLVRPLPSPTGSSDMNKGLTVHLSHGSDVVVGIFEADEAVAFSLACSFVSHHLRTIILIIYVSTTYTEPRNRHIIDSVNGSVSKGHMLRKSANWESYLTLCQTSCIWVHYPSLTYILILPPALLYLFCSNNIYLPDQMSCSECLR